MPRRKTGEDACPATAAAAPKYTKARHSPIRDRAERTPLWNRIVGDDQRAERQPHHAPPATPVAASSTIAGEQLPKPCRRDRVRRDVAGRIGRARALARVDRAIEIVVEIHAADIEQRIASSTRPVRAFCQARPRSPSRRARWSTPSAGSTPGRAAEAWMGRSHGRRRRSSDKLPRAECDLARANAVHAAQWPVKHRTLLPRRPCCLKGRTAARLRRYKTN